MSKVIIYSGFRRTWEKVKDNHWENILSPDDAIFYFPVEKGMSQLTSFPISLPLNAAPETHILNTLNQWRNRRNAFEHTPYIKDWIYVIARMDLFFLGKIDFSDVNPNTIYIPSGNDFRDGINDQFAFGTYEAIKHYCGLYEAYIGYFNEGVQFHPETYLKYHLRNLNVIRIPQRNEILRQ